MLKLVYEICIQLLVYYSWQRPYDTHVKCIVVINTDILKLIIYVSTATFIINKLIETDLPFLRYINDVIDLDRLYLNRSGD